METVERYASVLHKLQPDNGFASIDPSKSIEELNSLSVTLGECSLRIDRLTYFARKAGPTARMSSKRILDHLSEIVRTKGGSLDVLAELQQEFNRSVRATHAELLELD